MTLVVAAPKEQRGLLRVAFALLALLVAALVVFGLGALIAGTVPVTPKNPFGVGLREAAQSSSGLGGWLLAQQEWFYRHLETVLKGGPGHPGIALGMILLAFVYGVFHAGGPGHGKAVISAYLIANEQALRRGIFLSCAAALLQAFVAIGIVLTAALVLHATAIGMTRLADHVELISFAAISLFGIVLTWRKAAPVASLVAFGRRRDQHHGEAHGHEHTPGHAPAHDHAHGPYSTAMMRMRLAIITCRWSSFNREASAGETLSPSCSRQVPDPAPARSSSWCSRSLKGYWAQASRPSSRWRSASPSR